MPGEESNSAGVSGARERGTGVAAPELVPLVMATNPA